MLGSLKRAQRVGVTVLTERHLRFELGTFLVCLTIVGKTQCLRGN